MQPLQDCSRASLGNLAGGSARAKLNSRRRRLTRFHIAAAFDAIKAWMRDYEIFTRAPLSLSFLNAAVNLWAPPFGTTNDDKALIPRAEKKRKREIRKGGELLRWR